MPTARPFAFNPGAPIAGTEQIGSLAVGTPTSGFTSNPQFWNGPDEELGYVIAKPISGNTQPTPLLSGAPFGQMSCSTIYKGVDINLSNNNQTASQQFGYQMTVLTNTFVDNNDKVMFSVLSTPLEPLTLPQSRFIGVGKTTMNYQGNPYGGYPGNDTQSIGFNAIGEYYYNGSVVQSGLPTWISGDTVDIAISHGQYWWIRVNGGNWNNNPSANPATLNGGLSMNGLTNYYPALCPGYEGTMTIQNTATYGTPIGYTLLGNNITASVGFNRSKFLTEPSFIEIAEYVSNGQTFATGIDAKIWLNANGYWTSWQEPANGILTRAVGVFDTVTGSTIVTFSSSTFSISGSSYLPVFDGESKEFSHGDIEIGDTLTIGLTGTPFYLVALTKNSTTFLQQSFWYTPETGVTFNTAVSTGDTLTVSVAVRVYEYENPGIGSSAIEACSSYPTITSSKYSVFPWGEWGDESYIFNDSQFTSPFTSSYVANIGFGTSTVYWKETDSNGKVISQGTCPSSTSTPTPTTTYTPTNTPTPTSTLTPTPSVTPGGTELLVYLDSGNPSSYPGTGSTWTDLEGGDDNATLFNSPTFSSSYQGILQFDDTSLEYATIPDLGNLSKWTVEAWFRLNSPLTGKVTAIVTNEFDLVDKLNFSIGTNNAPTNRNISVGFFDGSFRTTTGVVPQVGVWYQVVGTYDGSVVRQYVNGVASGGTVNYVGTPESGGEVRLMRRWDFTAIASNLVDGDLAIVKIYNGAISDAEVLSNYNSTYTRFLD